MFHGIKVLRQVEEEMKLNNIVLHCIFKEKNMGFSDQTPVISYWIYCKIRESAMNPTITHLSESVGSAEHPIMGRQKAKGIPLSHNW